MVRHASVLQGGHRVSLARPAMSVNELEAAAEELRLRQIDLKAQLAAAKRRLASSTPRRCTPWMRAVAVKVLALADFDDAPVAKYLEAKGRSENADDVRAWYESLTPEALPLVLAPDADLPGQRQLLEAKRFLGEFRLAAWVQEQNKDKGIAPTASAVLEQAGPDLARQTLRTSRYRWLQQCMRRWGGRRVHFAGGPDELTASEFERKASSAERCFRRQPANDGRVGSYETLWNLGAGFSAFGGRFRHLFGGPNLGPYSGPAR